jgi:hypothetical protein
MKVNVQLPERTDLAILFAKNMREQELYGLEYLLGNVGKPTSAKTNAYPMPTRLIEKEFAEDGNWRNLQVILKNKGREQKRTFGKIPSRYLKVGSKRSPLSFTFTRTGEQEWRDVVKAAVDAYHMLQRRAPVDSGAYRRSIRFAITRGGKDIQQLRVPPSALLKRKYEAGNEAIGVYPSVVNPRNNFPYSQWLEYWYGATDSNFVGSKRRGGTYSVVRNRSKRGGIVRYIAMRIARKYPNLAVRFSYAQTAEFGGTMPFIFIARKGTFANRFARPGAYKAGKLYNRRRWY